MPRLLRSLCLGLGLGASCAPRPDLPVSWSFADGRGCADAGAEYVQITAPSEGRGRIFTFRCPAGSALAGRQVAVGPLAAGAEVSAAALTPAGGTLYRGSVTLSRTSPPGALDLLLRYTGGR